jgi:hypothetical protein
MDEVHERATSVLRFAAFHEAGRHIDCLGGVTYLRLSAEMTTPGAPAPNACESPGRLGRLVACVAIVAALVVGAFRAPTMLDVVPSDTLENASSDRGEHEGVITRDTDLGGAQAARSSDGSDSPDPRESLGIWANVAFADALASDPWTACGARGSVVKPWTPSAPSPAELMVFLN